MMTKRCPKCTETKPTTDFYRSKTTKDGLYGYCKDCHKLSNAKSRERAIERDPDYYVKHHLKYNFGFDVTDVFNQLVDKQDNRCAICSREFDHSSKHTKPRIDHCHDTDQIRGLLCDLCNKGLGQFKDSIESLEAAIRYLRQSTCS